MRSLALPLVPVHEWLVLGEVEDVRSREITQITILDKSRHVLRGVQRRVEQSLVAQTTITAVPVDLIRVDGDNFLDGQEVDLSDHFASFFSVEAWRLFTASRLSLRLGFLRWRTGRI